MEGLGHAESTGIGSFRTGLKGTGTLLAEQRLPLGAEGHSTRLGIDPDSQNVTHQGVALLSDVDIFRAGDDHQTLFGIGMPHW